MKKIIFVSALISFITSTSAQANANVKKEMRKIYGHMENAWIKTNQESRFAQKKNKVVIKNDLTNIKSLLLKTKEHFGGEDKIDSISLKNLLRQIDRSIESLKVNNFSYSRSLIRSLPRACFSCHFADSKMSGLTSSKEFQKQGDLYQADFYKMTRNYKKALKVYQNYINSFTPSNFSLDYEYAVHQIVEIYIKAKNDPKGLKGYLETFIKKGNTPIGLHKEMKEIYSGLSSLKPVNSSIKWAQIDALAKQVPNYLSSKQIVRSYGLDTLKLFQLNLAVRKYQQKHKNSKKVQSLYYLAASDISSSFMDDGLADLYLINCMEGYPGSKESRKCYELYKTKVELSFTGSAGTRVPKEILMDLEALEKEVKDGNKILNKDRN